MKVDIGCVDGGARGKGGGVLLFCEAKCFSKHWRFPARIVIVFDGIGKCFWAGMCDFVKG